MNDKYTAAPIELYRVIYIQVFRKKQNIGLLWTKVRMFCIESTEVCPKEVRCFHFPEWAVFTQSRLKTDTVLSDTEETGPTISAMGTKSKRDVLIYAVCFSKIKEVCSVSPLKYTHYTLLFHFLRPPLKKTFTFSLSFFFSVKKYYLCGGFIG